MAASGLGYRKPLFGTAGWAISHLLCTDGSRKQFSSYVGPPFLAVKLFSWSVQVVITQEQVGVVRVTGWLQCHLSQVTRSVELSTHALAEVVVLHTYQNFALYSTRPLRKGVKTGWCLCGTANAFHIRYDRKA